MSKHTKGNWKVDFSLYTNIISSTHLKSDDVYIASLHRRDKVVEGKKPSEKGYYDKSETIANANLIASAPELLHTLKSIRDLELPDESSYKMWCEIVKNLAIKAIKQTERRTK